MSKSVEEFLAETKDLPDELFEEQLHKFARNKDKDKDNELKAKTEARPGT